MTQRLCRKGLHLATDENTFVRCDWRISCRICKNIRQNAYRRRKREEKASTKSAGGDGTFEWSELGRYMQMKLLTLTLLAVGLAAAQTSFDLEFFGVCASPNDQGSNGVPNTCEPANGQQTGGPVPSAHNVYTTGLHIPILFQAGNVKPQIPTPQFGVGQITTQWFDGAGGSGTITITTLNCRFDSEGVIGNLPFYQVSCSGTEDGTGNVISFTHKLYLSEGVRGFWSWHDQHGPEVISFAAPPAAPVSGAGGSDDGGSDE